MTDHHDPDVTRPRSHTPDQAGQQQLATRLRAQLAVRDRPVAVRAVDAAGTSRTVTPPPQPRQAPYGWNPYGPPHNQGLPQNPYRPAGQSYPGSPGYGHNWGNQTGPGYRYPPGPAGPQPQKSKTGLVVALILVLVLVLGVGGFFGVRALTGPDVTKGSGEIVSPPGKGYSVEVPQGMVNSPRPSFIPKSIPSETDLYLQLKGKEGDGGVVQTGTVSGEEANLTYEELGAEATRFYTAQYEGHPEKWGQFAQVDQQLTKVGGRDAVQVDGRFSDITGVVGDPDPADGPTTFFRIYFIDAPSGPPLLIECDWNNIHGTEAIDAACTTVVRSFKVTAGEATGD
jgi:hypothetical protein